jgi:hypothetical protein
MTMKYLRKRVDWTWREALAAVSPAGAHGDRILAVFDAALANVKASSEPYAGDEAEARVAYSTASMYDLLAEVKGDVTLEPGWDLCVSDAPLD